MAATAASDVPEGPVMSLVNKRIRALRKKLNRITQMEESIAQGKQLNKEQEEVLRSKPSVSILIEELEKFRQPLTTALSEEIDLAIKQIKVSPDQTVTQEGKGDSETQEKPTSEEPKLDDSAVEDLLNLLYFGSLFDVKPQSDFTSTMLTRTHERGCCLTYDYVTDDATDLLGERDLDMISVLSGLLISRPVDSSLSHKNALQSCIQHAKLWLSNSEQPLDTNFSVSYAALREKLRKIMASEYFTTTPEIKAHIEVAAAAGNYAPFQVPGHATVMPIAVPFQEDGSAGQYQQKPEDASNLQEHEAADSQSSLGDENQNDGVDTQSPAEFVPDHQEHLNSQTEVEQYPREVEYKEEQQYGSRRPYQNQRGGRGGGGGRRGYSNGRGGRNGGGSRGGGAYSNGRNQFHDQQPGNYYPRNYYNNNRGGRGGRSGGQPYHNGSTVQGGHSANDVGVAS